MFRARETLRAGLKAHPHVFVLLALLLFDGPARSCRLAFRAPMDLPPRRQRDMLHSLYSFRRHSFDGSGALSREYTYMPIKWKLSGDSPLVQNLKHFHRRMAKARTGKEVPPAI